MCMRPAPYIVLIENAARFRAADRFLLRPENPPALRILFLFVFGLTWFQINDVWRDGLRVPFVQGREGHHQPQQSAKQIIRIA